MSEKVYPQERAKHTPGPWKLYGFTQYGNTAWYVQDAYRHLTDEQLNGSLAGDQVDSANARLIAAAPALLEELESLIERSGDLCEFSDAYYRSEMQGRIEEARALLDEVMS